MDNRIGEKLRVEHIDFSKTGYSQKVPQSDVRPERMPDRLEDKKNEAPELDEETVKDAVEQFNKIFTIFDTSVRLSIIEGTNYLRIQVIDLNTEQVIREFPPADLVRKLESLKDFVGMIIDEKG